MSNDQVEGTVKRGIGHVQDAAGFTGDDELQIKGTINQVAGRVQDKVGDLKDSAAEFMEGVQHQVSDVVKRATSRYGDAEHLISENPLIAIGIAAAVGIGVGLALRGLPDKR